ncbi:MAG: hypothetical protein MUD08_15130 [Cytophagales bacterium]|jgi:hypothetical protein|nr:hypothetical protein [Cytophagales bacterium]
MQKVKTDEVTVILEELPDSGKSFAPVCRNVLPESGTQLTKQGLYLNQKTQTSMPAKQIASDSRNFPLQNIISYIKNHILKYSCPVSAKQKIWHKGRKNKIIIGHTGILPTFFSVF